MAHTLEVFSEGIIIFHSDDKWLYPLFELEQFLSTADYEPSSLIVKDKIIGRAAALLIIRLKIGCVKADIMSKLGKKALDKYCVINQCNNLVDRITCSTEEMLQNEYDPEGAYKMLRKRAGF